jgi:GT2 family glycosyltransferase
MIPTFNPDQYLARAIASVLEQFPGPSKMEIQIVDDCSTAVDVEGLVKQLGSGLVTVIREEQNQGTPGIFNSCIRRANGYLIHILHSDDYVLPGFYDHLQAGFESDPAVGAAFCRHAYIDQNDTWLYPSGEELQEPGVIADFLNRMAYHCLIQPVSIAVRRSVYEELGGYNLKLFHSADWEMWARIASRFKVWFDPKFLACYRKHDSSHTSKLLSSGANIANTREAIDIIESYLPKDLAGKIASQSRAYYACYAASTARRMLIYKNFKGAAFQTLEMLKCVRSMSDLVGLSKLAGPRLIGMMERSIRNKRLPHSGA